MSWCHQRQVGPGVEGLGKVENLSLDGILAPDMGTRS